MPSIISIVAMIFDHLIFLMIAQLHPSKGNKSRSWGVR